MKAQALGQKIADKTVRLATVGLGYVGLPLSVEFASAGLRVVGIDIDREKVDAIGRGESYVRDVPSESVAKLVKEGTLSATADFDVLSDKDAVIICVPTPLSKTKDPDLSLVVNASREIAKRLRDGQLVVLESTTYPGTTEELILPSLQESGLEVGKGFFSRSLRSVWIPETLVGIRATHPRSSGARRRVASRWRARFTRTRWTR